ncbi:hypothetical protein [Aliidiomarina indica]|uniref:hypothetical protein n=1 Tax=Aliidiomarina indica TaxID=2749147 RepID=UPI00188E9737|nr:hypothetical protein [Aliidiomarina indica]
MHVQGGYMQSTPWTVWMCFALVGFGVPVHAQEPCPPLQFHSGPQLSPDLHLSPNPNPSRSTSTPDVVSYTLQPALLRPQLEYLLKHQWHVQNVIWYAAYGHYWPTHYELSAASWDELLDQLLTPYGLRVVLHDNHTAVVEYTPQGRRG